MKTADAALANIYGANAANVFIGLGLPWTIACFYYWGKTGEATYSLGRYEAADIAFAVVLLIFISIIVFITLFIRRYSGDRGELGGGECSKFTTGFCFIMVWILFVILNTANSYEKLGERDIFLSQSTQLVDRCPVQMKPPFVFENDMSVKIDWGEVRDSDAYEV